MLRILELDKGEDPARMVNFSAIDPLMDDPNEAADQILGLMNEKGLTARNVHAAVLDHGVELRQVSLPILGKNEMRAVVRREIKKIVPDAAPKDIAFDFWYDKSTRKGRKTDVLIGVIPKEGSRRIMSLMELVDLDTQLITTVPMALIAALKVMGEKYLNQITAMVHLERERSFLVIANRGNWVFSREFQSVVTKEAQQESEKVPLAARRQFASARFIAAQERLLTEVNRSLLYFKQRFRGEGVSLAVLSGEAFNLDEIAKSFESNLGLEAAVFSPVDAFQIDHLGERANKLVRIFPSLILPIGAALENVRDAKLNFVPPAYINRRKARVRRLLMTAATVVFFIIMTIGYILIRNTRVELEKIAAQNHNERVIAELTAKLQEIDQLKNQRELARKRREFLQRFDQGTNEVENLLIALSHLIPDDVLLHNLSIKLRSGNTAEIVGQVKGRGIADSDKSFNLFYTRLKNSGLFSDIAEPMISTRSEKGVYLLNFKIDCKLAA